MEVIENASDDQQEFSGILASQSGGGRIDRVCSVPYRALSLGKSLKWWTLIGRCRVGVCCVPYVTSVARTLTLGCVCN